MREYYTRCENRDTVVADHYRALTRDYKRLLDERNRHNLELLERCLCVVCIDDDVLPTTFNNPMKKEDRWIGDRDYANVLHHALHGGGSRHLGANRWFDKTFHAILGKVRAI